MSQADHSPIMSEAASRAVGIPTYIKTRHLGCGAKHGSRSGKDWRRTVDRGLEIIICIGHIVGVVMLIADHLF